MADEWQPVVGGRAIYTGATTKQLATGQACIVRWIHRGDLYGASCERLAMVVAGEVIADVDADSLREHPDDARHRRLLEAARLALDALRDPSAGAAVAEVALDWAIAEHDAKEPDHAP